MILEIFLDTLIFLAIGVVFVACIAGWTYLLIRGDTKWQPKK